MKKRGKNTGRRSGSTGKRVLIAAIILFTLGVVADQGYEWVRYQFQVPMGTDSHLVQFTVGNGESRDQVAADLAAKGLIRSSSTFLDYVRLLQLRGNPLQLEAGDYALNQNMNVEQITQVLVAGKTQQISVRMPDGVTMKGMADQAQRQGVGSMADYLQASGQLGLWQSHYDFLRGWPATAPGNLEGFLYPDTYQLSPNATAADLIKNQLDRFNQVLTPDLRREIAQTTPARPAQSI
ncbi:MAG: endolytic transglycosylase MltG [Candidatus Dormibacteraceae bacterium]